MPLHIYLSGKNRSPSVPLPELVSKPVFCHLEWFCRIRRFFSRINRRIFLLRGFRHKSALEEILWLCLRCCWIFHRQTRRQVVEVLTFPESFRDFGSKFAMTFHGRLFAELHGNRPESGLYSCCSTFSIQDFSTFFV